HTSDGLLSSPSATVTINVRAGDSRRAVVASRSLGVINIVDLLNRKVELTLTPAGNDVIDVAVTPDGRTAVVTGFEHKKITFVDLTTTPPSIAGSIDTAIAAEDVDTSTTPGGFA